MTRSAPAGASRAATPLATSTALLTVDLGALRANYRKLAGLAPGAECAAVVKGDGYGTGAVEAARALAAEGCRTFFVATPGEAAILRKALAAPAIYVLDGLFPRSAADHAGAGLRPVLGSLGEIEEWAAYCAARGARHPAAIHVDTGMNRLGLPGAELEALARRPDLLGAFEVALIMSHLACADEPDHPKNGAQRNAFERARAMLPPAPASLANSAGILLGAPFHFDLVRPGVALYGGNPLADAPSPMQPVVHLEARIAQTRWAEAGETVGYGAARSLARRTRIATLAVGYADGYMRLLGSSDGIAGAAAYIGEHEAPILGRVSMDLITVDVTDIPDDLAERGAFVEMIGTHVGVDDLARQARTIGYEVLTSLGRRFERRYIGF